LSQEGLPEDAGKPNFIAVDRQIECASIATKMYNFYEQTGWSEFLDVAVSSANYFLTNFPERKAEFDRLIDPTGQDASPSVK